MPHDMDDEERRRLAGKAADKTLTEAEVDAILQDVHDHPEKYWYVSILWEPDPFVLEPGEITWMREK